MTRKAAAILFAMFLAIDPRGSFAAPPLAEVDLEQARAMLRAGKAEQARDALLALVDRTPDDVDSRLALGQAHLALGDPDAAVSALSRALDLAPARADAVLEFGRALLAQARGHVANQDWEGAGYAYTDARRYLERAAELDAGSVVALLLAATAASENGDVEGAHRLVERAVERDPKNLDAQLDAGARRYFAASALAQQGDLDGAKALRERAREAYRAALALDAQSGRAWNGLGWVALASAEPDRAIEAFTKSIEVDPTQDGSYRELLRLLGDTKENRQKLLAVLDKVVLKARSHKTGDVRRYAHGLAYFYRGKVKGLSRDVEGLDSDMKEAAKAWPDLAGSGALAAALALTNAGQYAPAAARLVALTDSSLDALAAAVLSELDPREVLLTLRGLADQSVQANDLVSAREVFRLVATAQNNSSDDWNNYAFFCRETRQYERSYEAYSRALELSPDDPGILNDTALILQYHLLRDLDYALELYERAIVAARRMLEDPNLDSRTVEATKIALRDATNNSRMLKAALESGDTKPPRDPGAAPSTGGDPAAGKG